MSNRPTPIGGRYAFHGLLKSQQALPRWLAQDAAQGQQFVASLIPEHRLKHVEAAQGANHPHLASVLQVIRHVEASAVPEGMGFEPGISVAVAEYVPGQTLHQFQAGKPLPPDKAVAWVLRLSEAVQVLHAQGAVHGAISPWSVIAVPDGRSIAPVLSMFVAPVIGAYLPPERLKGAADQESSDVWALHALLYTALTGVPPFVGADRALLTRQMLVGRLAPLSTHGVQEPALNEILIRGLNGEKRLRMTELAELIRCLDAWERNPKAMPPRRAPAVRPRALEADSQRVPPEHDVLVVDGSTLPHDEGAVQLVPRPRRSMPPLPMPAVSVPIPPPLPVSAAPTPPPLPVTAAPVPPPLPSASSQPSRPHSSGPTLEELSAQLLPALPQPPLGTVRPAHISKRLSFNPFEKKRRVWPLVVGGAAGGGFCVYLLLSLTRSAGAPAAAANTATVPRAEAPANASASAKPKVSAEARRDTCVTAYLPEVLPRGEANFAFLCEEGDFRETARRLFAGARSERKDLGGAGFGWYELPAAAIVRKSCCEAAPPPFLPKTSGWCEQVETAVRRVAEDSAKAGDVAPAARSFDKAVQCLFANHVPHSYSYERVPVEAQRRAFQQFLSLAAINEARR
ncbi:MAG TPA: hypothetical protein VFQ61_31595 [Polyangiaceae bacterium]|nr:hypothetical protein [Polyangiaceae bacterium]